jgi:prevent-host-death family protein
MMVQMKAASISEAKNRLSAYLELVKRGETVVITDRNVPVAQLAPLSPALRGDHAARLRSLERRGVIRRAKVRPGKDFLKRLPAGRRVKGDVLAALLKDRDESR